MCALAAQGQFSFTDQNTVSSVSGQFVVSSEVDSGAPPPQLNPDANTNIVQLKTALLAVSAERFKLALWRQLGIAADAGWSGRIFLRLHPARSLDETVTITTSQFLNRWNYEVGLPDSLWRMRYARTLSSVLLLELANRHAPPDGHSAEVPAWLVDGLAAQVLEVAGDETVLTAPGKKGNEIAVNRVNTAERGLDALVLTRQILRNAPALTFDQLSWPTDDQMTGADGGVYLASAQLFLNQLLVQKNGRDRLRAMVLDLPNHMNWQTAFFQAFGSDFKRPLDVEKWWALQVVNFARRTPGPRWTLDVSLARLEDMLSVPVEMRNVSNALPAHAEISLQAALKNLNPNQRDAILRNKVRDLALVELRLAPPFGSLADGYRTVLADFLGETPRAHPGSAGAKHGVPPDPRINLAVTLKRLDALDFRRRNAEDQTLRSGLRAGAQ